MIFCVIIVNLILISNDLLPGTYDILSFNFWLIILILAWKQRKIDKQYKINLQHLPTTAKSAETAESREHDKFLRELAMDDAIRGEKTDMRRFNW